MARRMAVRRRQRENPGGWPFTLAVMLVAVCCCLLLDPPKPLEVAEVFAKDGRFVEKGVDTILIPARQWYLVEFEGKALSVHGDLVSAEIAREALDALAGIRLIKTEGASLKVTATPTQQRAMGEAGDALFHQFDTLERMANLGEMDALAAAVRASGELDTLLNSLDTTLGASGNSVVRGLSGLIGSCREAMGDICLAPNKAHILERYAALVLQYEAYHQYLERVGVS